MAAPTATTSITNKIKITVTGTNVDAGNNDYVLGSPTANLERGFTVTTGTLTNMTVTILIDAGDGNLKDDTTSLAGIAALASDKSYTVDIPLTCERVVIRAARSNATNAVNLQIIAKR